MKKIYASAAAFQQGNLVYTRYASGCLRAILLSANNVREQIDPKYMVQGKEYEDAYASKLQLSGVPYQDEVSFTMPIIGYPDVVVSGRCDFLLEDKVTELKSSQSQAVLTEVIKQQKPKLENVAQLATYMLNFKKSSGDLRYRYRKVLKTKVNEHNVKFDIDFADNGAILIDKKSSGFSVYDLIEHEQSAADAVLNHKVKQRPYNFTDRFNGPCARCPFSAICDKYDSCEINSTNEFIYEANQELIRKGNKKE